MNVLEREGEGWGEREREGVWEYILWFLMGNIHTANAKLAACVLNITIEIEPFY